MVPMTYRYTCSPASLEASQCKGLSLYLPLAEIRVYLHLLGFTPAFNLLVGGSLLLPPLLLHLYENAVSGSDSTLVLTPEHCNFHTRARKLLCWSSHNIFLPKHIDLSLSTKGETHASYKLLDKHSSSRFACPSSFLCPHPLAWN